MLLLLLLLLPMNDDDDGDTELAEVVSTQSVSVPHSEY